MTRGGQNEDTKAVARILAIIHELNKGLGTTAEQGRPSEVGKGTDRVDRQN